VVFAIPEEEAAPGFWVKLMIDDLGSYHFESNTKKPGLNR